MRVVALACLLATAGAGPSCQARARVVAPDALVRLSALPRLKPAWTVAGLDTTRVRYHRTLPVADGALYAWSGSGADAHVVALELATGHERWRTPHPSSGAAQIELGTHLIFLNHADGETTALDRKTGRPLWTAKVCRFFDDPRDDGSVGFVRCAGAPDVKSYPDGTSSTSQTAFLIGFDLTDGRRLWQRDAPPTVALHAGMELGNVAVGARHVFLQPRKSRGTVLMIDPRTGNPTGQIALPKGRDYVLDLETSGGDLAIVAGSSGPGQPSQLQAIRMSDGSVVWSRLYPQTQSADDWGPAVQGTRMVAPAADEITEIDLLTGKVAFTHPFPRIANLPQPTRQRPLGGRLIVLTGGPAVVVRWDAKGGAPTLAALPSTLATSNGAIAAAADDVIVVETTAGLVGFRVLESGPSEQVALPPADRVAAILDRAGLNASYTRASIEHDRPIYEELRAIPGYERELRALVGQPHAARHDRAVDAVTALGLPGVADLLLDEIFRAPPPPPPLSVQQQYAVRADRWYDQAGNAYRQGIWRRADQVVMAAALDDAKAATRLGPLLLARSTPEGLGWWDANIWSGEGRKAWDGASRAERLARGQPTASEGALFSQSLPAMVGRSEAHAAVYRLLARTGRAEDLARLDELHRTTARAGGWAAICDADDAIKEPAGLPERAWVEPWGLCRGIDVGDYRVTQARNIVWLRRRRADGTFGPPAWAYDPGGDQCLEPRWLQKARLRNGRIQVTMRIDSADVGAIDPRAVFADRDGDGLTDLTEAAFGTDPRLPDTDGDGVPDGRDPAPRAKPAAGGDDGQVTAEMLRYATLFLVGGPLTVRADRADWAESPNAGALTLHVLRETVTDDQVCGLKDGRGSNGGDGARGLRAPFPTVRVEGLKIAGDHARGRLIWVAHSERGSKELTLSRVRGQWRVVDAPLPAL